MIGFDLVICLVELYHLIRPHVKHHMSTERSSRCNTFQSHAEQIRENLVFAAKTAALTTNAAAARWNTSCAAVLL